MLKLYRSLNISGTRFLGEYPSWKEASKNTKGYGSEHIFERVAPGTGVETNRFYLQGLFFKRFKT